MTGAFELIAGFGLTAISFIALILLGGGDVIIGALTYKLPHKWKARFKVLVSYSIVLAVICGLYTLGIGIMTGDLFMSLVAAIIIAILVFIMQMILAPITMFMNDYCIIPFIKYLMKRK